MPTVPIAPAKTKAAQERAEREARKEAVEQGVGQCAVQPDVSAPAAHGPGADEHPDAGTYSRTRACTGKMPAQERVQEQMQGLENARTRSDSSPDETANTSQADGVVPLGFNEASYISPLPVNGGLPAVGAGLAAAAAPLGHTDTKNVLTRQETDTDAHASPLGIAIPVGLHN